MNGVIFIRWAFTCVYISSRFLSEARLNLTVVPDSVEDGVTAKITAVCSYQIQHNKSSVSLPTLVSLALSRKSDQANGTRTTQGLAYLSVNNPPTALALAGSNTSSVDGQVSVDGIPTLTVTWENPSSEQAGMYTCEATFLSSAGHSYVTSKDFLVVNGDFHLAHQYTVTVTDLKTQLKAAEECCTSLTQNVMEAHKWKSTADDGLKQMKKRLADTRGLIMSDEYKGKLYVLTQYVISGADKAQELCDSLGGYLLEVDDADEWNFINSFIFHIQGRIVTPFYLGGRDDITEGKWYWTRSKKPIQYSAWNVGEPNNLFLAENCLQGLITRPLLWNDVRCSLPLTALCEMENILN